MVVKHLNALLHEPPYTSEHRQDTNEQGCKLTVSLHSNVIARVAKGKQQQYKTFI
jgi:hypothetical protein